MSPTATIEQTHLVNVASDTNHNKFYEVTLHEDGTVVKRWGRVGAAGQTKVERGGRHAYLRAVEQKLGRGYVRVDIIDGPTTTPDRATLAAAAKASLIADGSSTVLHDLVDRLVAVNKHRIEQKSGGYIQVTDTGVRTPLGRVSTRAIADARAVLDRIAIVTGAERASLVEDYLRLIPQKVGARAGWAEHFINSQNTVASQHDLLDQLESAVGTTSADVEVDFRYTVAEVTDPAVLAELRDRFENTKNGMHGAARYRFKRAFALTDAPGEDAVYEQRAAEIRNVKRLWHGSQAHNVLSILKTGLVAPKSRPGMDFHGAMFGPGIYFSEQSTKSLNYSAGYWGGNRDTRCFMFLADVVMGSEYRPDPSFSLHERDHGRNKFGKPWNSVNVKAGTCGVRNHEAIVWNTNQVRLRYLLEFEA